MNMEKEGFNRGCKIESTVEYQAARSSRIAAQKAAAEEYLARRDVFIKAYALKHNLGRGGPS